MKRFFVLLSIAALLTSCGGINSKYHIEVDGDVAGADDCNFMGDGITGKTNFEVGEMRLILLDCWKDTKSAEGVKALEGKTYDCVVEGSEKSEMKATITKVHDGVEQGTIGFNYDIEGTIQGDGFTGSFKVKAFDTKPQR